MAAVTSHVIGSKSVDVSRANRPSYSVRISARSGGSDRNPPPLFSEGPSCLFVGPIHTASKETLEALYRQAQDAYYSGNPLIVDDMFDRVEFEKTLNICRHSGQEDPSQAFALASVWLLFLGFGGSALLVPIIYTIGQTYQDTFDLGFSYGSQPYALESLAMLNGILFMALGSAIGYPIASASVRALRGLWKNDLVALKGECPNCGEEVFAFVRLDPSIKPPHKADCHVCESSLEFRTKVEESISSPGRRWVHGRIYLIRQRRRSRQ